jgi:hypothetical protein
MSAQRTHGSSAIWGSISKSIVIDYFLVAFFAFVSLALTPCWRAFVDCCIAYFFGTGELLRMCLGVFES